MLAMLAVILLVVPMLGCAMTEGVTHTHAEVGRAAVAVFDGTVDQLQGPDECGHLGHEVHCSLSPAPPSAGWQSLALQLLLVFGLTIIGVVGISVSEPDRCASGRTILTRLCVARR
ncbi:hypothetical protein NDR87_31160 [Nocardia sp. CDC159]|uniref:Lipoprotein LpqS n=1 Tax=Nocardia pulmonis TaxID=2951408 RepID=A0A9X2EBR3_9NOCA|nr:MULTISPECIES: hypothetical protein [Nocardia]MCM6777989.1 hypothetical protein [Nocardia pulmonis]MCM6790840.1 hypothetical protein [Nocardia sp. CDC159]